MITKLVTFGDSYMYGTELPQDDPDLKFKLETIVQDLPRDKISGAVPVNLLKSTHFDALWDIEMKTADYEERCHRYSISGIISKYFNFDTYKNYSWAGYSNDAIMSELILHKNDISPDTLVIVGLTFPYRSTKLNEQTGHNKIRTYNNYAPHNRGSTHKKYIELSDLFGDDILVKYLHVKNHIAALKEILHGIPHIIIDPVNIYRENSELNYKLLDDWFLDKILEQTINGLGDQIYYVDIVKELQTYFNENIFHFTFNHSLLSAKENNVYGRALLGHPSKYSHEHFANTYLIPYIINNFNL